MERPLPEYRLNDRGNTVSEAPLERTVVG